MKTLRRFLSWSAGAACYLAIALALMAYDNKDMHPAINGPVVDAFIKTFINALNPPAELKGYLFVMDGSHTYTGPAVTAAGYFAATTTEGDRSKTPKEWIMRGGEYADIPEVPAALRHFYDPLGIDGGKTYLTDRGTKWEWIVNNNAFNPRINAKDWALTHADNAWTFAKGKEWMMKALAEEDATTRDGYMARAWRCLGETLHLVADMGCPVHVRNDSHAAPVGWQYRWALGDPDPYEELVQSGFVAKYASGKADPGLKSSCRAASTAGQVFDAMATFTNSNFFSNQTISGTGVKKYDPIITGRPAYPAPKLDALDYDPVDFTFYKTFPGGQRVKMCKDHSYFNFRGYPYIDADCVESQASVLMPNIMEAGANVMRLFIPRIEVKVNEAKADGTVKGSVVQKTSTEYPTTAMCRGDIRIRVKNSVVGEGTLHADGSFELNGLALEKDDEVTAEYSIGGFIIRSEEVTVGDAGLLDQLHACKYVLVEFSVTNRYSDGKDRDEYNSYGFDYDPGDIGLQPISWSGTNFTFQFNHQNSTVHTNWTITGRMSADGRTLASLTVQQQDDWFSGSQTDTETIELRLKNVPLDEDFTLYPRGEFNYGEYHPIAQQFLEFFSCHWDTHDSNGNPYSYDYVSTVWKDTSDRIHVQFHK